MPEIITVDDLEPFAKINAAKASAMINDAMADASRVAPCILEDDLPLERIGQFRSVLRAAILRWNETGSGALTQQTAGPLSVSMDTRTTRRGMFWPSELVALRDICRGDEPEGEAFAIDVTPVSGASSDLASRPDLWFQYLNPTPPDAP